MHTPLSSSNGYGSIHFWFQRFHGASGSSSSSSEPSGWPWPGSVQELPGLGGFPSGPGRLCPGVSFTLAERFVNNKCFVVWTNWFRILIFDYWMWIEKLHGRCFCSARTFFWVKFWGFAHQFVRFVCYSPTIFVCCLKNWIPNTCVVFQKLPGRCVRAITLFRWLQFKVFLIRLCVLLSTK